MDEIYYMEHVNPSDSEVCLTYAIVIELSAEKDRKHLGVGAVRTGLMGSDKTIQSGIAKYRDSLIPKHVHEDLATGKCKKLILDYSMEGFHEIDWDYISTIFGVEQSKIIWITSIWNPTHLDSQSEVTVIFYNFWERFVYDLILLDEHNPQTGFLKDCPIIHGYKQQIQDIKDLKIRKYYGLSYNRRPHMHRVYLLTKLKQEELLDRTAYSWGGLELKMTEEDKQIRFNHLLKVARGGGGGSTYLKPRDEISFREVVKSKQITFPNEELETNKADSINFDHISTAYFQIVSETHVKNSSNDPYLSEKSYKSFISGMPFVMWGNAFTIRALRDKGYRCYEEWINQSYDRIIDDGERLAALIKEIKRLYEIPPEQWSIMLKEMLPTIEYNHKKLELNCTRSQKITKFKNEPDILRLIF